MSTEPILPPRKAPVLGADEIHSIGYRRLDVPRPVWPGWPIARTLLVLAWRKRITKLALLMCLGTFVLHGGWLVVQLVVLHLQNPNNQHLNLGPMNVGNLVGRVHEVLASFVSVQFFGAALVLAVVAAGAIADDRRTGAFELYFSRPLTRTQYVLGKLLGAALVPVGVLLVPQLILYVVALGVAPPQVRDGLWWLGVPALGAAALATMTLATTVIGVSALGRRARNVGALYIALWLVLAALSESLVAAGVRIGGYLSPERNLRTVVDALFAAGPDSLTAQIVNFRPPANAEPMLSLFALLALNALALAIVSARVRAEVRAG